MNQFTEKCSREVGCTEAVADRVIGIFLENVAKELSQGNTVDLGADFGVFSTRLREPHLAENSLRTPKDSRYKVIFREGKGLKKLLKVKPSDQSEKQALS